MKEDYQKPLTNRRRVPRGTEQAFPREGDPMPPRWARCSDALAVFHL